MAENAVTFVEITKMLEHFPDQPHSACGGCDRVKSRLENAVDHIKSWQVNEEHKPKLDRPRVCLFAASHGVEADSVSKTKEWMATSTQGTAVINQLCKLADAELRIYELDIDNPSGDITTGDAMDEEAAARAITYGMMAIEPGLDIIILGSVGAGVDTCAQAINEHGIHGKLNPLEALRRYGGYDLCAMLGSAIAARMAGIPIFIDSLAGQVIKDILDQMKLSGGDHLYMVDDETVATSIHRGVAVIPSLKVQLLLDQQKACSSSQGGCSQKKAC